MECSEAEVSDIPSTVGDGVKLVSVYINLTATYFSHYTGCYHQNVQRFVFFNAI